MNLNSAELGMEYIIKSIETDDEELNSFLFSLGCYSGEPITSVVATQNATYYAKWENSRSSYSRICPGFDKRIWNIYRKYAE